MQVLAPAKINLSLRVLGRWGDGFHEIETLMAPITLADRLEIERANDGIGFTCSDPALPAGEDNLVVRAARHFMEKRGVSGGVRIALEKRVPHGAGLGGGSSDAAAMLLGLNELFKAGASRDELIELAAEIGSDVPFFIHRGPAICRGRGERVEPVEFPAALELLLFKPPFGVPTPWAYSRWRDSQEIPGVRQEPQVFPWGTLVNDLERPVMEKFIFLGDLKNWLLGQPEVAGALMSGSGSTMFAVLRRREDAGALAERARAEFGETLWTCPCGLGGAPARGLA